MGVVEASLVVESVVVVEVSAVLELGVVVLAVVDSVELVVLKPEMMLPDGTLDDATLVESESVKELIKDDKLESLAEDEDEDESDESPRFEVRPERVSDNDRVFCCEVDKTVDV